MSEPGTTSATTSASTASRSIVSEAGTWRWPWNAKKAHWFPAGEIRAACNGWLYGGAETATQASPVDQPGPDDCIRCWKAMRKTVAR